MNKEESIQKIQDQIEKVKEYIEYGMPYGEYLQLQLAFEDIVNLIQKQEKEIEELKNADLTTVYLNGAYDGEKKVKDKIKAKIEEIDIEIQCCEYADDDTEEYKQDIEKGKRRLLRDKAVLQSLLEKE